MKKFGLIILVLLLTQLTFVAYGHVSQQESVRKKVILLRVTPSTPAKSPGRNPLPAVTTLPVEVFIEDDVITVCFLQEMEGEGAIVIKDECGTAVYEEYATAPGEYSIVMEEGWSEIEVKVNGVWYWGEI